MGTSWDRIAELWRTWGDVYPSLSSPLHPPKLDFGTQGLPHWTACSTDGLLHCHWITAVSENWLYWADIYPQVTSTHWSEFCSPGNDIISEVPFTCQPLNYWFIYLLLGFSCPSPSNIPYVASFQLFSQPACSLWHAVQLVHVQFKRVTQSCRCGIGIISGVFWQSHHSVGSLTPLELSVWTMFEL